MKIAVFSLPDLPLGKRNVKDPRLDQVHAITGSKKKTYLQVELVGEDAALDVQAILASSESRTDLILRDLEFVETRLARAQDDAEKELLKKLKDALEKETFIINAGLSEAELKAISGYGLLTNQPITLAEKEAMANPDALLARALKESGFISFFTTGEKETRAWLIAQGTTAWEASGVIHSDIQRGFAVRKCIGFADFIEAKGESQAKQGGKMRLEPKSILCRMRI